MFGLVIEEFNLVGSLLLLDLVLLLVSDLDCVDLVAQVKHSVQILGALVLQIFDFLLHLDLSVLRLQLLPHCESHRTLIQRQVCTVCHLDFVANSQQKQSAFRHVQSCLSNDFVETL